MGRRIDSILMMAVMAGIVACGGTTEDPPLTRHVDSHTGENKSPIYGVYETTERDDASDLQMSSIAGTVVMLSGPDSVCSGVLVERDTVLSAAHCKDAFVQVTVTNDGKSASSAVKSYEANRIYTRFDDWRRSFDVAVVKLEDPIPPNVIKKLAPVFFGDIEQAWRTGRLRRDHALIVGYGRTCHVAEDCGYGYRLKGYVTGVTKHRKGAMLSVPMDPNAEACVGKGDSGGPIFMKDDRGVYHVVGVASYVDTEYDNAVWATTGLLYSTDDIRTHSLNNRRWILPRIGTSPDNDGVDDDFEDNCPPWHCVVLGLPLLDCFNPEQQDEDGDGVGDTCDNCPPSRCAPHNGVLSCRNSKQLDSDKDGMGDVCDFRPEQFNKERPDDLNRNLVGDHCEVCPAATRRSCREGERTCENAGAGRCVFDYNRNLEALLGLCERPPDHDKDDLPDACDLCPDVSDPPGNGNANANEDIEHEKENVGVTRMGDLCEPVPQLDFEPVLNSREFNVIAFEARALLADDGTLARNSIASEVVFCAVLATIWRRGSS